MKKSALVILCALVIGTVAAAEGPGPAAGFHAAAERGVHEQYVVVLEEKVARRPGDDVSSQQTVPEAAEFLAQMFGGKVEQSWEHVLGGFLVRMPEQAARALARHPWVASVSQDVYVPIEEALSAPVDDCYTPYDNPPGIGFLTNARALPWFSQQVLSCLNPDPQSGTNCLDNWGIDRIDQLGVSRNQRYSFTDRGTDIHVYVLDTGIRANHREFQDRFGFSRVVGGINYSSSDSSDTSDCYGHGTHVAGIIGGRTYGVAKDALLHPVRIFGCGTESVSNEVQANRWISGLNWIAGDHDAVADGTAVVNWSGGNSLAIANGSGVFAGVRTAAHDLAKVPTLLLVQAAGNRSGDHGTDVQYNACDYSLGDELDFLSDPVTYNAVRGIFIAGGSDESDGRWTRRSGDPRYAKYVGVGDRGSNVGSCVDLFAPAAHVVSASWQHSAGFCRLSGTSMAAPHVAGVAANYLQRNRLKTAQQVKDRLLLEATSSVLQSSSSHPNYIGAGSPNKLLDRRMPAVSCGVDRTLTTQKNVSVQFLASTLQGSGCLASDFVYSKFDTQFGTITIGGIGPTDILYYYNPPANWTGTDTFHYNVADSAGKIKAVGMVTVTVTP